MLQLTTSEECQFKSIQHDISKPNTANTALTSHFCVL